MKSEAHLSMVEGPSLMHEAGHSKLVHWDNPEGSDGEGGGKRVQDLETHVHLADSCHCMAKNTTVS